MEITRINGRTQIKTDRMTTSNNRDFSQSFSFAQQKKSDEQLKHMLDDIKKRGARLAVTKCYSDVAAYKKLVKEYLESVLEYMYSVKKDISFWQTQYFITVETVDSKLQQLTEMLLSGEKDNLSIASTIDEITGLIVDIYR